MQLSEKQIFFLIFFFAAMSAEHLTTVELVVC